MLDQLSGGRLELGVGRGVSPYELRNFGVEPENSGAMFDEALTVLLTGLTQPRLNFAGVHYQYRDVPMEPHPVQQPYPPLWYPTHTPTSIEYAGRHGFNFFGLGPCSSGARAYRRVQAGMERLSVRLTPLARSSSQNAVRSPWYMIRRGSERRSGPRRRDQRDARLFKVG